MAQSKGIKTDEFDSIVVGGGLNGLIIAHQLEGTGRKVALIDGLDTLGGSSRPVNTIVGTIDNTLKFFPDTPETHEALTWLREVIGLEIETEVIEAPPVTYDGRFKPFVGFGDQKVATASEIDAYAQGRYLRLSSTPKDWIPKLIDSFTGTLLPQSFATKMQVDDEFVIEIIVNGAKRLSGREVIFSATPQQLTRLLPESSVPGKIKQRLLKGDFWTSINFDLVHLGQVTDSRAVHVLKGANEEPCVGLFHPATKLEDGRTVQLSQWLTLVPRDITDEPELVASGLKQIKRQVKRAYETSLNDLVRERIVVSPTSHGELTGAFPEDGKWPKLQNLWVVSGLLDPMKNVVGGIRQARRTLASIAGEPAEFIEQDTDLSEGPHPTA